MSEQRNRYKGIAPRPWLKLGLRSRDGALLAVDLIADTGCPYELILPSDVFDQACLARMADVEANFGTMSSGWVRLFTPEFGLVEFVMAYGCNEVASLVRTEHEDFAGLVGLPVLRMLEYGGNYDSFWIRTPT